MYDEIIEIAHNRMYMEHQNGMPNLDLVKNLRPYEELQHEFEKELIDSGKINFRDVFHEPVGYYHMKCFLIFDYSVDKV